MEARGMDDLVEIIECNTYLFLNRSKASYVLKDLYSESYTLKPVKYHPTPLLNVSLYVTNSSNRYLTTILHASQKPIMQVLLSKNTHAQKCFRLVLKP